MAGKSTPAELAAEKKTWNKRMARCKKCYFGNGSRWIECNYSAVTGQLRSLICKPGSECTVFLTQAEGEKKYGTRRKLMAKRARDEISAVFDDQEPLQDLGDWRMSAWGRG